MYKYIVLFCIAFSLMAQPFEVGHRYVTYTDASRSGRSVPCHIYYPSSVTGDDTPILDGSFPVVSFAHGRMMPITVYTNIYIPVAANGYIVVCPNTENSYVVNKTNFATDMLFGIEQIQTEGETSGEFFYGKVDETCAIMGHSLGGAATLLAADDGFPIDALATFSAGNTTTTGLPSVTAPALLFAGTDDNLTPTEEYAEIYYDAISSTCKFLVELIGATHCQYAMEEASCDDMESSYPTPGLTRAEQHALTEQFLLPWLDYRLKGSTTAMDEFESLVTTSTDAICTYDCTELSVTETISTNLIDITISPNPSNDCIHICCNDSKNCPHKLSIYNLWGKQILSYTLKNDIEIKMPEETPSGIYFASIDDNSNKPIVKRFIYSK